MYDKVAVLNGESFNVFTPERLYENRTEIENDSVSAIEIKDVNNKSYCLPRRDSTNMDKPGAYIHNKFSFVVYPDEDKLENYEMTEKNSVDFSDKKSMESFMTATDKMHDLQNQMLETTGENGETIYKPVMMEDDSPEMRALKTCIELKHMDLDKYASRFGVNYPNDKRKLKDSEITSFLLKRVASNIDIEVDMVFRDKSGNIPNPMGKTVVVNMVPGNGNTVFVK